MPPKRKPKKVGADPPEVAAEKKKARKEKAAEKKLAKQKAAEERENFLKMERLRKEIERRDLNEKRFSKKWRDMIMKIKIPQIKEDVEVAWHTFDRVLDIKNYSISLLLDEVDAAQEQYQMNERGHLEVIDRLINTYKARLSSEERKYETELQDMIDGTLAESEVIFRKQTDDEVFLQAMMFAMEQQLEVLMNTVKGLTLTKVGEQEDNNRSMRRVAKFLLERQYHELWAEYVANLTKYKNDTEDLRKEYNVVKEKDEKARRIIARQLAKTANLFESIRKLKDRIAGYKLTASKEIGEISAERNFFNEAYWTVKTRFMSEQTADKDQLKIITSEFKTTREQLERILAKGENLLSLITICRKYETLEEKVMPFRPQAVTPELNQLPEKLAIDFTWDRSHKVIEELKNLELFWRRVGSVEITTKQLRLERDKLLKERHSLSKCLEDYINERSMPQGERPTPPRLLNLVIDEETQIV